MYRIMITVCRRLCIIIRLIEFSTAQDVSRTILGIHSNNNNNIFKVQHTPTMTMMMMMMMTAGHANTNNRPGPPRIFV